MPLKQVNRQQQHANAIRLKVCGFIHGLVDIIAQTSNCLRSREVFIVGRRLTRALRYFELSSAPVDKTRTEGPDLKKDRTHLHEAATNMILDELNSFLQQQLPESGKFWSPITDQHNVITSLKFVVFRVDDGFISRCMNSHQNHVGCLPHIGQFLIKRLPNPG